MASAPASQTLALSRSITPPRPARSPLRPPSFVSSGSSFIEVSTLGRGIHGRKNSTSSKSSSRIGTPSGSAAGATARQAESRTLQSSDASIFASKIEATFDQILVSDATIKLSFTPDTLRDSPAGFPSFDQSEAATPMQRLPASSPRRLRPRQPRARDSLASNETVDDSEEERAANSSNEYKAALFDIIHSLPPWDRPQSDAKDRVAVIVTPVAEEPPVAATCFEPPAAPSLLESPATKLKKPHRKRRILAKDEKRDLAIERQVNHDLMDLFSAPPPSSRIRQKGQRSDTSRVDVSVIDQQRRETLGRRSLSAIQRQSIVPPPKRSADGKKGYDVPPGLAAEVEERENANSSTMTGKGQIRFTTGRATPGPAPSLAPVSILRRDSSSTNVTATTTRNDREYESDAARAVRLAFAARFGDQASPTSSARHSRSSSTTSAIFPTTVRQSAKAQQQGLLLPREAVGAALRVESDYPVAFPPPMFAHSTSTKRSSSRGVETETTSPFAVLGDSAFTKRAPAAPCMAATPTLTQLRAAMLNADTREQCIDLLDSLLAGGDGLAERTPS